MTEESQRNLAQDDAHLFVRGACHVFAAALLERFPEEHYQPSRLSTVYTGLYRQFSDPARHIACAKRDFLIHAIGIESIAGYKDRAKQEIAKTALSGRLEVSVEIASIEAERLLVGVKKEAGCRGLVNDWGLTVDPDFTEEARRRALAYINSDENRFRLSVYLRS